MSKPKIAVFAGHGGTDPGAVSGKLLEKDYNLRIATALVKQLTTMGYQTVQNRTTDVNSAINTKCALANSFQADAVCEIHLNAGGGTGTEVWYCDGKAKSLELAQKILPKLAALGYKNRGVKNDKTSRFGSFGILRGTIAPAVLCEICFLDSKEDMARLDVNKAAAALAQGIAEFLPLPKTDSTSSSSSKTSAANTTASANASTAIKAGDTVVVTGAYASSASATSAKNTTAVGWTVTVGKLFSGSPYPYRLDNKGTPIGFANASALKKANNSTADAKTVQTKTHKVLKGDTLWSIAVKYLGNGSRNEEIKVLNGLKSDLLTVGQVLVLPNY
ncbi:MAG: N-acetylmuramoyl-L-alanine amidase [Oscillospiraceae bacterium]|nr:N-acetylmuramoyl-L-alanine amidase [Oscillospiraceae bacterium]